MKSNSANRFLLAVAIVLMAMPQAFAGQGFPGKGDPAAWSDALPYYNLANRYLNTERYEQAVEKYQEAISRYPYDPDFLINLGVACRKLENYAGAEDAFKKALALDPKDWMSWSNLGNAYLKQDKLKETIGAFQKSLQCNPPAAEKTKILQDITDINKFLSMQEKAKQTAAAAAKARSQQNPQTAPLNPADQARLNEDKKSSGWDWSK